mmetsp:Transcript_15503/g.42814  ORF Transcript_15503/g.42814 Transcript_15503/m.42814 type:complete len:224 (-) Transcript_15503:571-1242(-)
MLCTSGHVYSCSKGWKNVSRSRERLWTSGDRANCRSSEVQVLSSNACRKRRNASSSNAGRHMPAVQPGSTRGNRASLSAFSGRRAARLYSDTSITPSGLSREANRAHAASGSSKWCRTPPHSIKSKRCSGDHERRSRRSNSTFRRPKCRLRSSANSSEAPDMSTPRTDAPGKLAAKWHAQRPVPQPATSTDLPASPAARSGPASASGCSHGVSSSQRGKTCLS